MTNLWKAEGFLNSNSTYWYFDELVSKNVIMFMMEEKNHYLHSSFSYLCNKEATKNKLFYAFNCRADSLPEEGINPQRRLCIRNNVLLAIEDVPNSIASVSEVRSLLCTGPYHRYPVPLYLEYLRLLRVLHALSIRLYEFPMEVLKLVQLRCLALTYNGNLPTSIFKLWNLEYLIVHRHLAIVTFVGDVSYLPIEIWNMIELKSLHTRGRDLPHPCREGSLLPNLIKLSGVGPESCTKDVFEKIPNLEELSIHIDLPPYANETLNCIDHISHLHKLQLLQCKIANSILKTGVVAPLAPLSYFPSSLTMLVLKGSFGYPWEEMSKISSLPNLIRLKLQRYAFRGPKWEVHDYESQSLVFLNVEETDLEHLAFGNGCCLPAIQVLGITDCYKLKEIPLTFGTSLVEIQVIDCNPTAVSCAHKLKKRWDNKYADGKRPLRVATCCSWDDANIGT